MKTVVVRGPREVVVEERSRPDIEAPDDAIVRVTMSAIGGRDLGVYRRGAYGWASFQLDNPMGPGTVGREMVGIVEAVGPSVTRIRPGQRVTSPGVIHCAGCFYCKQGALSLCERRRTLGAELSGAQAEYVRVPNADAVLQPIPDEIEDAQAVFLADLLPGVFAGLEAAGVKAGDSVAVTGCGPTGLAALLLARTMGAGLLFASDHNDYRLRAAAAAGATAIDPDRDEGTEAIEAATEGRGVDVSVEAAGTASALERAAGLVRPGGVILSLGSVGREPLPAFLPQKQVRILFASEPATKNYMTPLVKMLARGVVDPTPLATHTLPLSEAARGYQLMADREDGALKVLLVP